MSLPSVMYVIVIIVAKRIDKGKVSGQTPTTFGQPFKLCAPPNQASQAPAMKPALAIPIIATLIYRAYSRKSLTPVGLLAAFTTAVIHATHPWSFCVALLGVFFLTGTAVTKVSYCIDPYHLFQVANIKQVKHDIKAKLTQSSAGSSGGEGPRNHIQVIANSGVASILILLHLRQLKNEGRYDDEGLCWNRGTDPLVVGIVA